MTTNKQTDRQTDIFHLLSQTVKDTATNCKILGKLIPGLECATSELSSDCLYQIMSLIDLN